MLANKLGITSQAELARKEERLSKIRALELFEQGHLERMTAGSVASLFEIHRYLFQDVYDFAGQIRKVNIAKGNFRFIPLVHLEASLSMIERMPQNTFDEIIDKYVEMNIAHPFREGNGRSTRIWLDLILKTELGKVVDWNNADREDYLLAMERSPIRTVEIKHVLKSALTKAVNDRELFMTGIDASYYYEGYNLYKTEDLG